MRTALRGQANLELGETAKQNGALEAERGHAADSSPEASPLPPLGRTQSGGRTSGNAAEVHCAVTVPER